MVTDVSISRTIMAGAFGLVISQARISSSKGKAPSGAQ
jgi:hypothetical protein